MIPQVRGTAPGLVCPVGDKVVYAVPGVPHEMKEMLERAIIPDLRERSGETAVIVSRTLRTWGDSESGLAETLAPLIERLDEVGNPTLAFLASGIEGLKVRLTAKAETEDAAATVLAAEEETVRGILGPLVFGVDDETMESAVLDLLRRQGRSLALAESVTGGLVAARITSVPGASEVFKGSVVSYATEVKQHVLGVPEGPVVSEEAAIAMAEGARRVLDADVGLALTGVAGPTEQDGQPVGTLFVGLCIDGVSEAAHLRLPGDRDQMRQFAVISSLNLLRLRLLDRAGARLSERLFVAVWPPDDVLDMLEGLPRPDASRSSVDEPLAMACHAPLLGRRGGGRGERRARRRPRRGDRGRRSRHARSDSAVACSACTWAVSRTSRPRWSPRLPASAVRPTIGPFAATSRSPASRAEPGRRSPTCRGARWPVATFALVRSHLGGGPARYETVADVAARAVSDPHATVVAVARRRTASSTRSWSAIPTSPTPPRSARGTASRPTSPRTRSSSSASPIRVATSRVWCWRRLVST